MSSSRETISIVLADKNPMVHTGLRELLINEGRFEIAASVADGKAFLAVVGRVNFKQTQGTSVVIFRPEAT